MIQRQGGALAGRKMNFLSLNVVKLNSFIFLLFSNLRFEIIYNEVNKRLGPKKAGAKKKKKKS